MINSNSKEKMLFLLMLGMIGSSLIRDASANLQRSKRVVGGTLATKNEFRYLVVIFENGRIERGGRQICGGAIISVRHVITAGHCLRSRKDSLIVVSGVIDVNDPDGLEHPVAQVIVHPDYQPATDNSEVKHDIGAIVVQDSFKFSGESKPVHVPHFQIGPGAQATIAGWGSTDSGHSSTSSVLYKLKITFSEEDSQWTTYCRKHPSVLCAHSKNATICGGDSGSPVVSGPFLVGVVSSGYCVPGDYPTVVNVYYYRQWIAGLIGRE